MITQSERVGQREHDESHAPTRDLVVTKPFTITTQNGEQLTYGVGTHKSVPLDVADHWYAQAHSLRDGEEPPAPEAASPVSDRERSARVAAEDEAQRLRVISQKATDDNAAAQLELTQLREQLSTVEAERDALRRQLDELRGGSHGGDQSDADAGDEEIEPTTDDVRVHRKGRRWFVHKGDALIGEFGTKEAADAKAAELRGSAG